MIFCAEQVAILPFSRARYKFPPPPVGEQIGQMFLFQQSQYCCWGYFHLCNGTKTCTHIFYTCTKQINIIIDNKKSVM